MSQVQTIAQKKVKARTYHTCDSYARRTIPRDTYWRIFLKDGNLVYTWKEHDSCREAAHIIWDAVACYSGEWPLISEVDIEGVKTVAIENRGLALLVFGSARVKEADKISY